MFEKDEREARESGDRSPLAHAIDSARELLGIDVTCVSRVVRQRDLGTGRERFSRNLDSTLPEHVLIMPLESADGRLHGSLVCRAVNGREPLDERDAAYLRVLGRVVGAQISNSESDREDRRSDAETSSMQALLAAVEARDAYTGDHSRCVVELSVRVARELGLGDTDVNQVQKVALLHDVGKVAIPDDVLQKRGPLTEEETELIRRHPAMGARIVGSVAYLAHLAPAIRSGHERWDGRGYPDGLRGDEIPLLSRITFVCDAYDAMVSDRPYRPALGPHAAKAEVTRNAGSQFCPDSSTALMSVLSRGSAPVASRRRAPWAPRVS